MLSSSRFLFAVPYLTSLFDSFFIYGAASLSCVTLTTFRFVFLIVKEGAIIFRIRFYIGLSVFEAPLLSAASSWPPWLSYYSPWCYPVAISPLLTAIVLSSVTWALWATAPVSKADTYGAIVILRAVEVYAVVWAAVATLDYYDADGARPSSPGYAYFLARFAYTEMRFSVMLFGLS